MLQNILELKLYVNPKCYTFELNTMYEIKNSLVFTYAS